MKKAETQKSWAARNPTKAAANRRVRSEHELFNRDYPNLVAQCRACDREVDMVMYGAGYACGVRARELRTVQQDATVGARCRECSIIDGPATAPRLDASGRCPRCDEGADRYDPRHVPAERRVRDGLYGEYENAGFTVGTGDEDPYAMAEVESAVRGWKTLGSHRPWHEV